LESISTPSGASEAALRNPPPTYWIGGGRMSIDWLSLVFTSASLLKKEKLLLPPLKRLQTLRYF